MKLSRLDSRAARVLALAALMALLLLRVPYLAAHEDLGRDMFVAWRLLRGEEFPLEGPQLAGTTHLGPIWYYVLAALQAVGRSWYGTLVCLGIVASTQIPLAYLAGKELHSRRAGMLWAVGLVVPSWTTYEWMLPLHPTLTAPCVLAFLICCLRYARGGERRYFYGMALAFTLALHAHPSNLALVWPGLITVIGTRRNALKRRDYLFAPLLVLAPLLPFLYADALRGFDDLRHARQFLGDAQSTGSPLALAPLFEAIAGGGTAYHFASVVGLQPGLANAAAFAVALGGVLGVAGLAFALRDRRTRRLTALALLATLLALLTVACLRAMTPYYMTGGTRVMLAGLVALGLANLGESVLARSARAYAVAVAVLACLASLYGNARIQTRGAWPFAWLPAFDVKAPPSEAESLLLTPAYAMRASGRFLCSETAPSIHGTYASQLLHNYAMEMRFVCAHADVHLGGNEAGRAHWIGLSRAMFAQTGVRPQRRVGPIGIVPARPLSAGPPLRPPEQPRYPVYVPSTQAPATHHVSVTLGAQDHLAVSNLAFALAQDPVVTVRFNGTPLAPLAKDRVATVFTCASCAAGSPVDVEITTTDFADVDIVLF